VQNISGGLKLNEFFDTYKCEEFTLLQWLGLLWLSLINIPFSIVLAVAYIIERIKIKSGYEYIELSVQNFNVWFCDDYLKLPLRG